MAEDKNSENLPPEVQALFGSMAEKIARVHEISIAEKKLQAQQNKMTDELQALVNEKRTLKKEVQQELKEKINGI